MQKLNLVATSGDRFERVRARDLTAREQESVIELALDILAGRNRPGEALLNPRDCGRHVQLLLAGEPAELFGALFLDNRHRVIARETLFHGTVDGCSVHPRIVVQKALARNAAALIFYHNHPSGMPEPSEADRRITQRLVEALRLVEIRVLDHFVVGREGLVSFAERGLM